MTYGSTFRVSACTDILLAGQQRLAAPTAKIGFHSSNFPSASDDELRGARTTELSYLVARGFADSLPKRRSLQNQRTCGIRPLGIGQTEVGGTPSYVEILECLLVTVNVK